MTDLKMAKKLPVVDLEHIPQILGE